MVGIVYFLFFLFFSLFTFIFHLSFYLSLFVPTVEFQDTMRRDDERDARAKQCKDPLSQPAEHAAMPTMHDLRINEQPMYEA